MSIYKSERKVRDLIFEGFESYNDLSFEQQLSLAVACYEEDPSEIDWSSNDNFYLALSSYIKKPETEEMTNLHNTLKNIIVDYYSGYLTALFDEICIDIDISQKKEANLRSIVDPVNGETRWYKV